MERHREPGLQRGPQSRQLRAPASQQHRIGCRSVLGGQHLVHQPHRRPNQSLDRRLNDCAGHVETRQGLDSRGARREGR